MKPLFFIRYFLESLIFGVFRISCFAMQLFVPDIMMIFDYAISYGLTEYHRWHSAFLRIFLLRQDGTCCLNIDDNDHDDHSMSSSFVLDPQFTIYETTEKKKGKYFFFHAQCARLILNRLHKPIQSWLHSKPDDDN